jgi:DNA-binding GntR family transcriptional regulator
MSTSSPVPKSAGATGSVSGKMAFAPHPIARRSHLRDLAAQEIRRLIISGEAPADTRLRLHELADHVGMSITPVREALLVLAQEGWVVQEPHRGFSVARVRRQDIADLMDLHVYLYAQMARRAAGRITPEILAELRGIDAEMRATSPSDARTIEEYNHRLHAEVNAVADAPRLSWFAHSSLVLPGGFGWAAVPGWLEQTLEGHDALLDALEAGDEEAAATAMRTHHQRAAELLERHLQTTGLFAHEDAEPVAI